MLEQQADTVARRRAEGGDDGIDWVVADACEFRSLEAADLASCDVVIAATGDDEDNLVVSLLARQEFAVPRIVARVNHPQNEWLFNENWGVDVAVSTPHLLTALTEEAVNVGSLVRLFKLEQGNVTLVEVTLDDDSPAVNQALRGPATCPVTPRSWPSSAPQHVVVPRGDTVLEVGDEVLALVTPEVEAELRRILE